MNCANFGFTVVIHSMAKSFVTKPFSFHKGKQTTAKMRAQNLSLVGPMAVVAAVRSLLKPKALSFIVRESTTAHNGSSL